MKLGAVVFFAAVAAAQEVAHQHPAASATIPLQPLAQQVRQLEEALAYLGQPLQNADLRRINEAIGNSDETAAVRQLESIPYGRETGSVWICNGFSRSRYSR